MTYNKLVKSTVRSSKGQSCTVNVDWVDVERRLDNVKDYREVTEQHVEEALWVCVYDTLLWLNDKGKRKCQSESIWV